MPSSQARAKINLSLAIVGRRDDDYHLLDSVVGFARDVFDDVEFAPGPSLALDVEGALAADAGDPDDNLILKAARALAARRAGLRVGAFRLVKRIPVAAGLGGGSADAAAALRLLAEANDLSLDDPLLMEAARATGADVPVCLDSVARAMRGVGDELGAAARITPLDAVLVNPRIACPTAAVFRELNARSVASDDANSAGAPPSGRALIDWLAARPNDLEAPAIRLVPAIASTLDALRAADGCALARMSGSGATCFGLFGDRDAALRAEQSLRRAHPGWWIAATVIE